LKNSQQSNKGVEGSDEIVVNSKQSLNRVATINNLSNYNLKDSQLPFKQLWEIADKHLVIIDESIIEKLGINDNLTTFVEQELTDDGILMRIKQFSLPERGD
jgi:hypothetical protein